MLLSQYLCSWFCLHQHVHAHAKRGEWRLSDVGSSNYDACKQGHIIGCMIIWQHSNLSCFCNVKVMSIQKKSSFSLASFLEKLPGDFFSHTEVPSHSPNHLSRRLFWSLVLSPVCRKTTTMTATCPTMEMRLMGRRMLWLNPASC